MSSNEHKALTRYGCHECREDSELVMSNRATPEVRSLYESHIGTCRHCRRMHRLLYAAYEGPMVPPPLSGIREEREFQTILRRMKNERPEPWYQKWTIRVGVTALAGAAAALTLSLFDIVPPTLDLDGKGEAGSPVAVLDDSGSQVVLESGHGEVTGSSLRHAAQAYGRIVGGSAAVLPPGATEPTTSNTFPVGTTFDVGQGEGLQVGFVGKMVANFSPGSRVTWETGKPSLIQVEVERGMAAFRYDRDPTDPILQVRTPTAIIRVVGTVFTVQVDDTDSTIVSVLRGQVDVLDPETNRTVAEVESGLRFDVARGTFDDVGKFEVQASLPLSVEVEDDESLAVAVGRIPSSWNVPGLPTDPLSRTLANVPARPGEVAYQVPSLRVMGTTGPSESEEPLPTKPPARRQVEDEGDELLESLMRDAAAARRKELRAALENCKGLYQSHETRYRAAKCFSTFLGKYEDHPAAVEAWALLGILRMDYALDYRAAEVALQNYLSRAPNGPHAEIAMYRMWLSSVEDGRISQSLSRGREYLVRYPNGRFVGKILQRFPELKSEI